MRRKTISPLNRLDASGGNNTGSSEACWNKFRKKARPCGSHR